jgi:hypothetical protein
VGTRSSKSHQDELIFIYFAKNHNFIKYHPSYKANNNNKTKNKKWQQLLGQIHTSGKRQQVVVVVEDLVEQLLRTRNRGRTPPNLLHSTNKYFFVSSI